MTAFIAASGVRSSCETSATNRRASDSIVRSVPTVRSSSAAVLLNVVTSCASSSDPFTRSRTSSLPRPSWLAAVFSARTGRSTWRAASSASTTANGSASAEVCQAVRASSSIAACCWTSDTIV